MEYMVLSIDRFECDKVFCEDEHKKMQILALGTIPSGAKEGDCLRVFSNGEIVIDENETKKRRAQNIALQNKLFTQDTNSD